MEKMAQKIPELRTKTNQAF